MPYGGAVAELPGVRLMASGLPHAQWNNGDVSHPSMVDVEAVRSWYAARDVPWGLRVPHGLPWHHGRLLFTKRLMGLLPSAYRRPAAVAGLEVRLAEPADLDAVVAVDVVCFDSDRATEEPWLAPMVEAPEVEVALGVLEGEPVGALYVVTSDGPAGRCAYVAGVGVLPAVRGRGVARAMTAQLLERAFAAGAGLAHLHPDDDVAASLYGSLGFIEVPGLDVYVDL